jgi:hypothetical protein
VAEGRELVGGGEMVKVRIRPGAGGNMVKGGLLRLKQVGSALVFEGPYFHSRMAHARYSVQARLEEKWRTEDGRGGLGIGCIGEEKRKIEGCRTLPVAADEGKGRKKVGK